MKSAKPVNTPLANHFKLSKQSCPKSQEEKEAMAGVPYSSAVGSLMYAMVCTRPDIAHAVGVVSRYLSNPGKDHWEVVKWILRYLKSSANKSLSFGKENPILEGYTDADMAEYIAMTEAGKEMLWLKRFLQQLGMKQERYDIHCDSQSALDLSKNAMYHSRTKHIDVRYHWLRQVVEEQQFKLEKIHTDENPADMMTKVVTGGKLQLCAELIGIECM
ncbi:Unknown protein [Striga hermonthica]|uniref:Retrovirus-related Pol polyprotein from transposon TNT 1-94 n=1 Tax=Striga hermonthica TaxID=68872 RepID=A0A9N7NC62_STRHE|nr:Unknown protein [Striga hermonthica]